MSKNPICFALDVPSSAEADFLVGKLAPHVGAFKVGLELFISSKGWWPGTSERLGENECPEVILDLKLHDIPETVGRAVTAGGNLGAKYMTLHVQQRAALEAAVKAAEPFGITLLGVTVLTSMAADDMSDLGMMTELGAGVSSVTFRAAKLVKFAHECGLRGFVCSPIEVKTLRELAPDSFFLVPGVRPVGAVAGDQKRMGTPGQAVKDGASLIVVGRPIRDAKDPVQAAKDILAEILSES